MEDKKCEICGRITPKTYQELHHLVPKCKKGKETILVCKSCGQMLHQLFTISELKNEYNTLENIKNNEDVKNWINWISKKNDFQITMARKKKK